MEAVTNSQIVPLDQFPPSFLLQRSRPSRNREELPLSLPLLLTPLAPLPPPRTERPTERDPRGQSRFVAVRPISFEEGVSPGLAG